MKQLYLLRCVSSRTNVLPATANEKLHLVILRISILIDDSFLSLKKRRWPL